MELIKKKVSSLKELKEFLSDDFSIFGNKNNLTSFDNETEILIVGTYIPHNLDYFYFGNSRMYGSLIDFARKTHFEEMQQEIIKADCKEQLIDKFVKELKKEKIAFLDLFEYTLINPNEVSDNRIKAFTLDLKYFENITNSKKLKIIIPISKAASDILKTIIGDDSRIKYHQLINGGTNKEWIEIFSGNYEK